MFNNYLNINSECIYPKIIKCKHRKKHFTYFYKEIRKFIIGSKNIQNDARRKVHVTQDIIIQSVESIRLVRWIGQLCSFKIKYTNTYKYTRTCVRRCTRNLLEYICVMHADSRGVASRRGDNPPPPLSPLFFSSKYMFFNIRL